MKKHILILLIFTGFLQAQTYPVNPTKFGKISLNTNSVSTSTTKINTQESDGQINYIDAVNLPIPTSVLNVIKQKADLSTGLIKNGLISINADPTKFNVSAGIGIISNFDNPELPVSTVINFPAFTGVTPTYLLTGNITYIAVNSTPAIVMQATPFTPIQRRDLIVLGAVIHSNLTNINVVNNISAPSNAIGNQLHDFIEAVGALNITGNKYSANGANLSLNKSAGSIFKFGVNFATDWKNPHQISQSSGTALTFRYRTQNGTEGSDVTVLNPAVYDLSNVLTAVPNNKFTIQTVTMFQTGLTRIQYGQNYYDDLASAQAAIFTRDFNVEANIKENGVTRAYIIVKNNATSLQNATDSRIIEAQKFGGVASGGVALTFANIVSALGYTPANDVGVVHKTGDTFSNSYGFPPLLSRDPLTTNINTRILEPESTRLSIANTSIFGWGDSLTAGDGFISSYPYQLNALNLFSVVNKGVPGETSTQIKDRFIADTGNYDKSVIIWAGRNNYASPATVKADIATIISTLTHTRYLVVGIVNGDYSDEYTGSVKLTSINQLNADLKTLYGDKFVDIRPYLVSLHTNSAQDLIDFANDVPPTSLRIDQLHYNTSGYTKIAEYLNQRLGFLFEKQGYLQSKDFKYYFENYSPLHSIGNESFTGLKSVTNSGSLTGVVNGINFTNSGTHVNSYALGLYNTNAGSSEYGLNTGTGSNQYFENANATGSSSKYFNSGNSAISITNATGATQGILINTITGIRGVSITNTGNSQSYYTNLTSNGTGFSANVQSGFGYLATVNTTGTGLQFDNVAGGVLMRLNSQTASTGNILEIRKNNTNVVAYNSNGVRVVVNSPTTSVGGYEFFTRNTTTGFEEKIPSANIAPSASPTFTGTAGFYIADIDSGYVGFSTNTTGVGVNRPAVFRQADKLGLKGSITNNNAFLIDTDSLTTTRTVKAQNKDGFISLTLGSFTVATLPTPTGTAYAEVTDALAPTYMTTVVGGGSVVTPVFYNGTNWVCH